MATLNRRLVDTGTPPIPEALAWTRAYDGARGPLLDLSQAVPGYPPHPDILEALREAAGSQEAARYGDILGDGALRDAYAAHVSALYEADIDASEVAVTAGCNQAFFAAMIAMAGAGDAVLLPTPWYFNHKMTLDMLGIEARALPCEADHGFVPDVGDAEALIDGRVRAVVLVTPNNPTGAVYPPETIAAFADLCARRGLWLVIDETYRDFLPPGIDRPHALFDGDWRGHVVQLYSFSKAYCIPGHRLGAAVAGEGFLAELAKVLDCVQICPARAGQIALTSAVPSLGAWRTANRDEIAARARAFREAADMLEGWRLDAIGAYFAYLRHPFDGVAADGVARALAAERGVLALPGRYFGPGQERHLRVAFANAGVEAISQIPARLAGFRP